MARRHPPPGLPNFQNLIEDEAVQMIHRQIVIGMARIYFARRLSVHSIMHSMMCIKAYGAVRLPEVEPKVP